MFKNKNTILLLTVGIFFLMSSIYLYFQNLSLKKPVVTNSIFPTLTTAPIPPTLSVSETPTTFRLSADDNMWTTYVSKKYTFSIDYPDNWNISCSNPIGEWLSATICDLGPVNTTINNGELVSGINISIGVEKINPNYSTLEEKINYDVNNYNYKSVKKTINNAQGYLLTSSISNVFVTKVNDLFFSINWIPIKETSPIYPILNRILNSFKFIN